MGARNVATWDARVRWPEGRVLGRDDLTRQMPREATATSGAKVGPARDSLASWIEPRAPPAAVVRYR